MNPPSKRNNLPFAPPRPVYSAAATLRTLLLKASRRLAPASVTLFEQLTGTWHTEMLYVAAQLGIADLLAEGPKSVDELAAACHVDTVALGRLLRALSSTGVFERDKTGRYRLNRLARPLCSGVHGSLRDLILYAGSKHSRDAWAAFSDVVKTGRNGYELTYGKGLFDYLSDNPQEGEVFSRAMAHRTEVELAAIVRGYEFSRSTRICDVGGGRGTLLCALLGQHAHLRGVLYDGPMVVSLAEQPLRDLGLEQRCERIAGSFFEHVPLGCDTYILKDILHDWDDARAKHILKNCREAMDSHAKLLIVEMLIVDDDAAHPAKLLDLQMMTGTHDGRQRSRAEFDVLLRAVGLRIARVVQLPSPTSVVEAVCV